MKIKKIKLKYVENRMIKFLIITNKTYGLTSVQIRKEELIFYKFKII
jgi:hypothetical protein